MNETNAATPVVKTKARLSNIWLLPLLAAIIGAGMVYNNWQNQGTEISITFDTAEGLTANKTVLKYRNVDIGLVKEIGFNAKQDRIVVSIEVNKEMSNLLNPDAQFWVVRPRISAGGVSGIGTLLSGAYIEIAPGIEAGSETQFVGLETPPVTPPNAEGIHLTLESSGGKPLVVGSAVIYRGFNVGKVESFEFDPNSRKATYGIFIRAPYDALVTTNTIFWNASGFTVTANTEGVKFDMASLDALIDGGVEFDVPAELDLGDPVVLGRSFRLYSSKNGLDESREYRFFEYLVLAEDSVGGLHTGAPVEYLGIRVGTVAQPYLTLDTKLEGVENLQEDPRIPILIHIEPERVYKSDSVDIEEFKTELERGMLDGVVATVQSANLLTGSLKISLNPGGQPISSLEKYGPYTVIPAKRGGVASITDQIQSLLTKLDSLPLERTVNQTNKTIGSADTALASLDQSLRELQTTLKGLQPDSQAYVNLNDSMYELQSTLREFKPLLRELSNRPSSLIFSKTPEPDDEPKAKKTDD